MRIRLIALCLFLGGFTGHAETYVTEGKVAIDRCASAWFIKRYIDPEAVFQFIATGETPPAGVTFGFYGAKYFNKGQDCTFTALVKASDKGNVPVLREMNTLVNDTLSWRQGPNSPARFIREGIDDVRKALNDDSATVANLLPVFDLVYLKLNGPDDLPKEVAEAISALPQTIQTLIDTNPAATSVEEAIARAKTASAQAENKNSKILALMVVAWETIQPGSD